MNKSAVRSQILAQLRAELALQTRAAQLSRDEAISEESRPENQYDMHSQEAAYLAEGQARLAAEIAESVTLFESMSLPDFPAGAPVALGALVAVEGGSRRSWYLIGPRGGGTEASVEGQTVLVLTPSSPLGRELLGKKTGDAVRLPARTGSPVHRIVAVM